jgi:hypothetical protein
VPIAWPAIAPRIPSPAISNGTTAARMKTGLAISTATYE